jgi:hypothetical protein
MKWRSAVIPLRRNMGGDMKRLIRLEACPLICLAVAACSGANPGLGNLEVRDVEVAALFAVPTAGVKCIRITASNPRRTSSTDFGVTGGASTSSFTMQGIPTGNVVFSGAAFAETCAFIVATSGPTWISDDVVAAVSPGGPPPSVTLRFHGVGAAQVGVDFGNDTYTASTLAGNGTQGSTDGIGSAARFEGPNGIALDGDNLYIVDRNVPSTIVGMTVRRLKVSTGEVTTIAGSPTAVGTADGPGSTARFSFLRGIAVSGGLLYVIDRCAVRTITTAPPFTVSTLVGTRRSAPPDIWQCGSPFLQLLDIVVRPSGIFVADAARFIVSKIDASTLPPTINTVAGVPDVSGSDDGPVATAHLLSPTGLVFPFAGEDVFYVGDVGFTGETTYGLLRRVSIFEDAVTTVAGAVHGAPRIEDGFGIGALFNNARRFDTDGNNLFIGDTPAIRRMDVATFAVTTIAGGNTSGYADGPGSTTLLSAAFGIARGPGGKIFFSDQGNFVIRVLTP